MRRRSPVSSAASTSSSWRGCNRRAIIEGEAARHTLYSERGSRRILVVDGGEEAVCEAAILQVRLRHLPCTICTICTTERDKVKIAQSKGSVDQARQERLRGQRRECGM